MTQETPTPDDEVPIWKKSYSELTEQEKERWRRVQSPRNQAALKEIIAEHQLWMHTNGREGAPLSLSHQDLSGAWLDSTIFNSARAKGLQLVKADLEGANLHKANLQDADISREGIQHAAIRGNDFGTFTARMFPERDRAEEPLWEIDPRDHLKRSR